MVWIKVCGITSREDAEAAAAMGADCLGFIFSTHSPRRIGPGLAASILDGLEGISRAGVFVNETIEKIRQYIDLLGLDHIQLSGDEDTGYIKELKDIAGKIKIIKALRLKKTHDSASGKTGEKYLEYADYLLLDSYHRYHYGGTGKTIDWQGVKGLADPGRIIVSGGLYDGNVGRALETLDPFGVDASSGLEAAPGKKDPVRVQRFIKAVRRFEGRRGRHE